VVVLLVLVQCGIADVCATQNTVFYIRRMMTRGACVWRVAETTDAEKQRTTEGAPGGQTRRQACADVRYVRGNRDVLAGAS